MDGLFRSCGRAHPGTVTEGDLVEWVTAVAANNRVRARISTARTFFRRCARAGVVERDPTLELDGLRKQYPKTYGKVQGLHPARWLTYGEVLRAVGGSVPGRQLGRGARRAGVRFQRGSLRPHRSVRIVLPDPLGIERVFVNAVDNASGPSGTVSSS